MCENNFSHETVEPSLDGFSVRFSLFYEALLRLVTSALCSSTVDELVAGMPNTNMKGNLLCPIGGQGVLG